MTPDPIIRIYEIAGSLTDEDIAEAIASLEGLFRRRTGHRASSYQAAATVKAKHDRRSAFRVIEGGAR